MRNVLVVTPVLNDWESFALLRRDLGTVGRANDIHFTIFAIDDGSADPVPSLPADQHASVQVIHLVRNLGHQRAIAVGLVEAFRQYEKQPFEALVVMDSDGEDPPRDIPSLLAALQGAPSGIAVATRDRKSTRLNSSH